MLVESSIIAPHGGHLVDRRAPDDNRKELVGETLGLPHVALDARTLSDLQMIASGVFSPLEGFMLRQDYESVVEDMRLANGLDRKSTRLNSSHANISYAVFCLKKKKRS